MNQKTGSPCRWWWVWMVLWGCTSASSASVSYAQSALSVRLSSPPAAEPTSLTFTVDQLIGVVLAHNPDLRAGRRSVDAARAGVTSAAALANPKLELQQGRWRPLTATDQTASGASGWSVSQAVENPSIRRARVQGAEASLQQTGQLLAVARNDLVALVRTRAYEALLYQSEAMAAAEALSLLEQVRERVRVRVETGEAARYEMIKADAEVIHARERQQTAGLQAEQTLLELNRLAAGQLPAKWKLVASFGDVQDIPSTAQLQAQAERANPDLMALRHELDRAQAKAQGARASRWPGVELRYSESREPDVRLNMLSVGIALPLLDQRSGPIAEALAEAERVRIRLEGRQIELKQQIVLARKAVDIARLRVEALSQGVLREAESALRVAQAAYRFGERGILDVLDAQRVLRGVRTDLLQARYQLQTAHISLDQLAGRYAVDLSLPSSPSP